MWRLFNGIPRAIRQHFNGTWAAAGICKEEETCTESEFFQSSHVEKSTKPEDKSVVPYSCNWPPGFGFEERKSGSGTNHDQYDWWRTCDSNFWSLFNGSKCALEAVTWGAAVILGIQLSRPQWRDRCLPDGTKPRRPSCLLYRVAFALPGTPQTAQSVRETHAPHQNEALPQQNDAKTPKKLQEIDPLEKVMNEFEEICDKYTAVGSSVMGLTKAQEGNMAGAVKDLKEASKLGHVSAQFNLGLCYEIGKGVKKNLGEAVKYYQLAAEEDHTQALYNLALLYLKGEGGVAKDTKLAMSLLEQAAQRGLTEAQTYLGIHYTEEEQQDMKKAVLFFTMAAEQNDPEAQYFLGICYEQGWGVDVNECKAANLYSLASQGGHDGAMYNLAVFHEHGLGGIPQDPVSAIDLYTKSAEKGNESAKFKLDEMNAHAAILEWSANDAKEARHLLSHKLTLSPSGSSPSLTDYVKEHISQLSIGDLVLSDTLASHPNQVFFDHLSRESHKNKRQTIAFFLGDNEDSLDGLQMDFTKPVFDIQNPSESLPSLGMHRISTMPELSSVACL